MTLYKSEKTPEIVFISPSILYGRYFDYDLSVAYIQAYLKEKGIYSIQIAQNERISVNSFVNKILTYNPKIVGILCSDRNYYLVKIIAGAIKKRAPKIVNLVLGQIITFSDLLIMEVCPYIDICVRREGEHTTYEIIQFLDGFMQIEKIEGITYRKDGRIISNPDRPLIGYNGKRGSELDILPSPYLNEVLTGLEGAGILTSRGCSFGCIYCLSSAAVNHTIRYHSEDRVISEVRKINRAVNHLVKDDGTKVLVKFLDRDFSSDIERAKRICRILTKEKFNLEFFCELRADRVDEELLELLYKAGFREINLGLESAVPRILRNIKKVSCLTNLNDLTPERNFVKKFKENIELAKKIGLSPSVNIMLGLPGESIKDARKTLEFIKGLDVNLYYHHRLSLFPGTELFKTYKRYGLRRDKSYDILTYGVKHLYNVDRLPYYRNAVQFITHCKELRYFTDIVFGCPWQKTEGELLRGNKGFPFVIFNNFSKIDENLFKWIKDIISINAYLLFVTPYKMNEKFLFQKVRQMVSMGLPTKEYHFLSSADARELEVYFRADPRPMSELQFSFKMIPLSEIYKLRHKKEKSQVIVTLHTEEDIQKFVGLLKDYNVKYEDSLLSRLIDLNISFLDGCRWLSKDCFASNPCKVIVEKDIMKLCTHSGVIGKVGDNYDEIVKILKRKFDEDKDRRNCRECPAKKICSRCLYPYPLTAEEYCAIRKNNPQINTIMWLLSSLRDFELRRDLIGHSIKNFTRRQ